MQELGAVVPFNRRLLALHFAGKEALQLNVSFKAFGSAVCSQKSSVDAYCMIRVQELLLAVVSKAI
jgi:hypothetical protein